MSYFPLGPHPCPVHACLQQQQWQKNPSWKKIMTIFKGVLCQCNVPTLSQQVFLFPVGIPQVRVQCTLQSRAVSYQSYGYATHAFSSRVIKYKAKRDKRRKAKRVKRLCLQGECSETELLLLSACVL